MICLLALFLAASAAMAQAPADGGARRFEALCAGCHGGDGRGGERGPNIVRSARSRRGSEQDLRDLIRQGIPNGGMPGFDLPPEQLAELAVYVQSLGAPAAANPAPGDVAAGEQFFLWKGHCASCHMRNGRGGRLGPDLSDLADQRTLAEIRDSLLRPSARIAPGFDIVRARLRDGRNIRAFVKNQSNYDLQLQTMDGHWELLPRTDIVELVPEAGSLMPEVKFAPRDLENLLAYLSRPARASAVDNHGGISSFAEIAQPKPGEWPTYHGHLSGNRHSPLEQIHTGNVTGLAPRWMFSIPGARRLQVTPVVTGGVMYVTAANEAYALDARTGRQLWRYRRPLTKGLVGDAAGAINRGVAMLGDGVFMVTDNAHLIALDRSSGRLLWDVEMADSREHYGATSAPLVAGDMVVSGVSGGDEGIRGFLAAYHASTGERAWRFWTVPAPGEPLAETWRGNALFHGCAPTWLTGTFDPLLNLLYWPTGNPCPDFNGDERQGDNLYSNSVLALEPQTGRLRWYYQFTPHDLHDWDATETPMLVDAVFGGRPRRLLAKADRNGFFYVLDRETGKVLLAKPFVEKMTWASGIGADGRPQVLPGTDPTPAGVKVCPSMAGATNWMSTAYSPQTGLFYLMALEKCSIYTKSVEGWKLGESYYGGAGRDVPGETGSKHLRAIRLETGEIAWDYPQLGPGNSWGGVLSTAGGLVFFGDDSGAFAAVDARSGKPLWHFNTSDLWKASPMTYLAGGKQFVAVAAGGNILAFGL